MRAFFSLFTFLMLATQSAMACSFFISTFCETVENMESWEQGEYIVVRAEVTAQMAGRADLKVLEYFVGTNVPVEVTVTDLPTFDCNGAIFSFDTEEYGPVGTEILAILQPEYDRETGQPTGSGYYTGRYTIASEHFLVRSGNRFVSMNEHSHFNTKIDASRVANFLSGCLGRDVVGITRQLNIYPVPAQNQITFLVGSGDGEEEIRITDQMGRLVFEGWVYQGYQMDISEWAPGIYYAYLPRSQAVEPRKLIKVNPGN